MNKIVRYFSLFLVILASSHFIQAFTVTSSRSSNVRGAVTGGSNFVLAQKFQVASASMTSSRRSDTSRTALQMGSQAKFGVFSPAVYMAKVALGQEKLNKIRGKAISLHSEAIGDFCQWVGAYHLRTKLIKKAKTNGDILGFLV